MLATSREITAEGRDGVLSGGLRPVYMPWYTDWFGTRYYKLLYRHRNEEDAKPWVDAILHRTALGRGHRVLDLACGRGRHAHWFNEAGLQVTGVDISEESIEEARRAVPGATFLVHDIRTPVPSSEFDLAVCLFTSIGYFDDSADDQRVLASAASALKAGGAFVLDLMNPHHVRKNLVPFEELYLDGVRFRIERSYVDGVVVKRIQVEENGAVFEFQERVRTISPAEVLNMLDAVGLEVEDQTDGPVPRRFDRETSERCVTWAKKPGP
ncbi:MAG TPA: class I SAM-dependent methyltransferase [Flavobacteriales bacterium]|nr:class I SAM-dependent methyltransferase [Flavobacteriales bacterium]